MGLFDIIFCPKLIKALPFGIFQFYFPEKMLFWGKVSQCEQAL
jgi:hypothetical protein